MTGDRWAPLRNRSARSLILADLTSALGTGMALTATAFAVLAIGGGAFEIGIALAVQNLGIPASLLFGGVLGDRYSRRTMMILADLARFGSQGVLAVLLLTGDASFPIIVATQVVHGIGTGFYIPASIAIVPDAVPEGVEQRTNALKSICGSVSKVLGPALGAAACQLSGPGLAIAADALTFLGSAALLTAVTTSRRSVSTDEDDAEPSMLAELREGWSEFIALDWLKVVTIQFTLVNALAVAPLFVFGPALADGSLGGVDTWAAILSAMAVGELIGGALAMTWRPDRPLVAATLWFMLWGLPLFLIAIHAPLILLVAGAVAAGAGAAIFDVLWQTVTQEHTPEAARSRLLAFEGFGSYVGVPIGFLFAGWIGSWIGPDAGLLGSFAVLTIAGIFVLARPSVRLLTNTPTIPEGEETAWATTTL